MKWKEAYHSLKSKIHLDLHLTPNRNFKIVREIPPYICRNYNNTEGFRVQIGLNSFVNIPTDMLQIVFEASLKNNRTYNRSIFRELSPRELNTKPCNVHEIGNLFEHAGIMKT